MTTLFALLVDRCGLSQHEAAELLDVRIDTIRSWANGRRNAPERVIAELRALYARIEAEAYNLARSDRSDALIPSESDIEARALGWPCAGAHRAAVGIALARRTEKEKAADTTPRL